MAQPKPKETIPNSSKRLSYESKGRARGPIGVKWAQLLWHKCARPVAWRLYSCESCLFKARCSVSIDNVQSKWFNDIAKWVCFFHLTSIDRLMKNGSQRANSIEKLEIAFFNHISRYYGLQVCSYPRYLPDRSPSAIPARRTWSLGPLPSHRPWCTRPSCSRSPKRDEGRRAGARRTCPGSNMKGRWIAILAKLI